MKSLEAFKEELLDFFTELGWKHWTKLGVSGRERAGNQVNVDPEALILLTGFLGERDLRLIHNVTGWLVTNQQLVNKARLKKIIDVDHDRTVANLGKIFHYASGTTDNSYWETVEEYCAKLGGFINEERFTEEGDKSLVDLQARDYKTVKADRKNNRMIFRTLFGTTVRAELFNFFFGGGSGNSRSIAQYTQLSQSTVHTILNELVEIGLIDKRGRSRSTSYEMLKGHFSLEGLRPEIYFDWANYVQSTIKAWERLETLSKPDSEYKTRSALRQFALAFSDNLSDWNAKFGDMTVSRGIQAEDFMEKEEAAEDLLTFVKQLPAQAGGMGSEE